MTFLSYKCCKMLRKDLLETHANWKKKGLERYTKTLKKM